MEQTFIKSKENKREEFFTEYLILLREVDTWLIVERVSTIDEDIQEVDELEDIFNFKLSRGNDLAIGAELLGRFHELLSRLDRIEGFLVNNPNETLSLLNIGMNRAINTYRTILNKVRIVELERIFLKLYEFKIIRLNRSFRVCNDEVEELFSVEKIRETIENPPTDAKRKVAKTVWNNITRFKLLNQLGIEDMIITSGIPKGEQNKIVSQIMGVNIDNARKLIDGKYPPQVNTIEEDELKELKPYIDQIRTKRV